MLTNKRPSIEMCRVCDQISTSIPYNKEKEIETFDNLIKDKIQNGSSIYIEPGYKALIAYFSRRGVGFHCNAISEKDFCLFNSYDTYKPFMDLVKENHYIICETLPNSVLEAIALSRHHILHTIKRKGQSLFLWDLTHDPTKIYTGRHPCLNPEGMLGSI